MAAPRRSGCAAAFVLCVSGQRGPPRTQRMWGAFSQARRGSGCSQCCAGGTLGAEGRGPRRVFSDVASEKVLHLVLSEFFPLRCLV